MTTTNNKRDFSQGKIYKIEPMCEYEEGDIYIGSTTQDLLCKRFRNHRSEYGRYKNGLRSKTMSYDLFDKFGVDNCKIVLIEIVNTSNLDELKSREAYYIRTLKCVNKIIPLRTAAEYYQDNKTKLDGYNKQFYEDNIEQMKEYHKQYKELNKEKISEYHKQYNELNKDKIKKTRKQRYERKKQEKLDRLNNTLVVNL